MCVAYSEQNTVPDNPCLQMYIHILKKEPHYRCARNWNPESIYLSRENTVSDVEGPSQQGLLDKTEISLTANNSWTFPIFYCVFHP